MAKTREITFWVSDKGLDALSEGSTILEFWGTQVGRFKNPVKICFEKKEKKIELTESMFDEAASELWETHLSITLFKDRLKQKLFGGTNDN